MVRLQTTPDTWGTIRQDTAQANGQRITRLQMLPTIQEHELTHRSRLFMYLRLKGIVPPRRGGANSRQSRRRARLRPGAECCRAANLVHQNKEGRTLRGGKKIHGELPRL